MQGRQVWDSEDDFWLRVPRSARYCPYSKAKSIKCIERDGGEHACCLARPSPLPPPLALHARLSGAVVAANTHAGLPCPSCAPLGLLLRGRHAVCSNHAQQSPLPLPLPCVHPQATAISDRCWTTHPPDLRFTEPNQDDRPAHARCASAWWPSGSACTSAQPQSTRPFLTFIVAGLLCITVALGGYAATAQNVTLCWGEHAVARA